MRLLAVSLSALLTLSVPSPASAQTSATQSSPVQAISLLQQSLAALVGNTTLSDITLTGSVRRIAGSDDETGTANLKAVSTGSARLDLTLSSGPSSETQNLSSAGLSGEWSGPDGVVHSIALHNLCTEPAWFFPAFSISRVLSTGYNATDLGPLTFDGSQAEHISLFQNPPSQYPVGPPTFQHLTQLDFYLDPATHLPVALVFNEHPDNNALLDIAIKVSFSDYRNVNGLLIPFHIQKYVNGGLFLDIQLNSAMINSGILATEFTVQ